MEHNVLSIFVSLTLSYKNPNIYLIHSPNTCTAIFVIQIFTELIKQPSGSKLANIIKKCAKSQLRFTSAIYRIWLEFRFRVCGRLNHPIVVSLSKLQGQTLVNKIHCEQQVWLILKYILTFLASVYHSKERPLQLLEITLY